MDGNLVNEENLRRLSYVDLQRCAKMWGIKAKAKTEKLITEIIAEKVKNSGNSIILRDSNAVDEASETEKLITEIIAEKVQNSDNSIIFGDSSAVDEASEVCQNSSGRLRRRRTRTFSVESPFGAKTPDISCTTLKMRSSKKSVNNHTPTNRSVKNIKSILSTKKCKKSIKLRNGNGHKVSFITPGKKEKIYGLDTPVSSPSKIRNRPQTPASWKNVSAGEQNFLTTSLISETRSEVEHGCLKTQMSKNPNHEIEAPTFCDEETASVSVSPILPSAKSPEKPKLKSCKTKKKKVYTPNLKDIHQREFEKMESVEEYEQRRQDRMQLHSNRSFESKSVPKNYSKTLCIDELKENSKSMNLHPRKIGSSKITVPFQGIRFVPSVTSIKKIDTNFTKLTRIQKTQEPSSSSEKGNARKKGQPKIKLAACQDKVFRFGKDSVQNVQSLPLVNVTNTSRIDKSLIRKNSFDLKASLAKKLPYKPYRGALKPFLDKNVVEKVCPTDNVLSSLQSKAIVNERVTKRGILKGVRKNRRFELQMQHRCLAE